MHHASAWTSWCSTVELVHTVLSLHPTCSCVSSCGGKKGIESCCAAFSCWGQPVLGNLWCSWKFLLLPLWCLSSTMGILQGKSLSLVMSIDFWPFEIYWNIVLKRLAVAVLHWILLVIFLPDCTSPFNLYLQQLDSNVSDEYRLPLQKLGLKQSSRNGKMGLLVALVLQRYSVKWLADGCPDWHFSP